MSSGLIALRANRAMLNKAANRTESDDSIQHLQRSIDQTFFKFEMLKRKAQTK